MNLEHAEGAVSKNIVILSWILRIGLAAGFLVMGAIPKLTSDPMAIALFEKLGADPAGRYAVGLAEAAAAILLLIPKTAVFGGLFGAVIMLGALGTHILGPLGFPMTEIPGAEAGTTEKMPLAIFAILFLAVSGGIAYLHRSQLPMMKKQMPAA